jgi:hypothetical protein
MKYAFSMLNRPQLAMARSRMWKVDEIILRGQRAFANSDNMNRLYQAIAEYFYPERADFYGKTAPGDERYFNIFDEEPMLLRRNLANQIGALIRPRGREWFKAKAYPKDLNNLDPVRIWCEQATKITREVIYNHKANFSQAMTESDNDYVAFGVSVVTHTYNRSRTGLIFKALHPRGVAWYKNDDGEIDEVYEKFDVSLKNLLSMGLELPKDLKGEYEKNPHREIEIMRCVYPVDHYGGDKPLARDAKFVVMYIATGYKEELKSRMGIQPFFRTFPYWIREWVNVSGEPKGRSPCTSVALATARGLNQTALSIIEGLEKLVSPPLMAPDDGIAGEVQIRADGVTFYDPTLDYGSRNPIEALPVGRPDFGMEYAVDRKEFLARAFLQNIINFPQVTKEMTAYEAGRLWEQYMRDAAPVFEPLEADNGRLMEPVFERIYDAAGPNKSGAFPPPPEELYDADVRFEFETPLSAAYARIEFEKALEASQYMAARVQFNPGVVDLVDHDEMDRAALQAIIPQSWIKSMDEVERDREEQQQQQLEAGAANMALTAANAQLGGKDAPRVPTNASPIVEAVRGGLGG